MSATRLALVVLAVPALGARPVPADVARAFDELEIARSPEGPRSDPLAVRLRGVTAGERDGFLAALRDRVPAWGARGMHVVPPGADWASARRAGSELGVDLLVRAEAVEARLVDIAGGLWDEAVTTLRIRRIPGGASGPTRALRTRLETARPAGARTLRGPVRAFAACAGALAFLQDEAVEILPAFDRPGSVRIALEPLEPTVPARTPAAHVGCADPDGFVVAHGAYARWGALRGPPGDGAPAWTRTRDLTARVEAGTNRFRPSAHVVFGASRPAAFGPPPFLDAARSGDAWLVVHDGGRARRVAADGRSAPAARVGRGLAALSGDGPRGWITSAPTADPEGEALLVLDGSGTVRGRLPWPEPIFDVAVDPRNPAPADEIEVYVLHGTFVAPTVTRVVW